MNETQISILNGRYAESGTEAALDYLVSRPREDVECDVRNLFCDLAEPAIRLCKEVDHRVPNVPKNPKRQLSAAISVARAYAIGEATKDDLRMARVLAGEVEEAALVPWAISQENAIAARHTLRAASDVIHCIEKPHGARTEIEADPEIFEAWLDKISTHTH